jgi:hypothetical protein
MEAYRANAETASAALLEKMTRPLRPSSVTRRCLEAVETISIKDDPGRALVSRARGG